MSIIMQCGMLFSLKKVAIGGNSVELRKDDPQSPALKKQPRPVVMVVTQ
jgi:hypothetical protein